MQRPILTKVMLSVMISMLLLVTFGTITFAWIGISTYSRIENFDLTLDAQELKDHGLEISLTGEEGTFDATVSQTELKRQILLNYYNNGQTFNEEVTYTDNQINEFDSAKVSSAFNSLVLDQSTIKYQNGSFLNDDKTDFNFETMNDKEHNYVVEIPTTRYFKFDLYVSLYNIYDDGNMYDNIAPYLDDGNHDLDEARIDAYLKGTLFTGTEKRVSTIYDYTYPANYLNGYSQAVIPANIIPGNTLIDGIKKVNSASSARLMFAKRGVVEKYKPEEYSNLAKNQISAYKIFQTGSKLPTVTNDVYSFGGILKDEANYALQNYNLKNPTKMKTVPLDILSREQSDFYYNDQTSTDDEANVISAASVDEQIGIRHMMKMTIYFWIEGWDSDCFDVIDRSPVSININLVLSRH